MEIFKNPNCKKIRGSHILEVSCAYCKCFIAKYQKVGESNLVKMYNDRIMEGSIDFSQYHGAIFCPDCGERIATRYISRRWTRRKHTGLCRLRLTRRKYKGRLKHMKKLDLNKAAGEFESISDEHELFYNIETGEFDFYIDPIYSDIEVDSEKFEKDCWIRCPSQRDLREYDIMERFADTITDPRARELLFVSLEGRGVFQRFKDTLHRVGLVEKWYDFKHDAFVELAREWCDDNDIQYENITPKAKPIERAIDKCELDIIIIPLHERCAEYAIEIMRDALNYSKHDAEQEIKRMMKKPRVALVAIAGSRVVGIIGAIPQYGVTGWELHPLAVLKEYQKCGVGSALIEALEQEVAERGGIMLYLGSDDETGTTSLYGADLYDDTFEKLANIQNTGGHPFPFYEKMGYKIVGVFPDANGIGKPDIWMAKRLKKVGR